MFNRKIRFLLSRNISTYFRKLSLSSKFNLLTSVLILSTSVGISFFLVKTELTTYYRDLVKHGETIADTTAKKCEFGIYTEDRESLLKIADSLSGAADIAFLAVLRSDRQLIVFKGFKPALEQLPDYPFISEQGASNSTHADFINKRDGQRYTEIFFPVVSNAISVNSYILLKGPDVRSKPKVIGYVRLGLSQEALRQRIRQLLISTTLFTTLLVLLGVGLTLLMTKKITLPLMKLKEATQEIAQGKFDAQIELSSHDDEIADLATSFNHMLVNLRTYRDQVEARTNELITSNQNLTAEINGRKVAEEQLQHHAFYDTLTGLPNRALFMDRLEHALAIAKRRKNFFFGVLFLDLDRFKNVNDSLGHIVGDKLLIGIGQRLSALLRPGDTVARLGGDEFCILLEDISGISNAVYICERIEKEFSVPFNVSGHEIFATTSVGIALNSPDYERPEQVLRDADTAMYQAKVGGKSRYVVFEPGMHASAVARLRLETDLRRAVERQEFQVYYQPILSMKTSRILGFEALARWNHSERGLVSPDDFISLAEETGIIVAIDRIVLREACRQMREWLEVEKDNVLEFVAVNLSNKQMAQPDLVSYVAKVLHDTGLDPKYLKLEITEHVIVENIETTTVKLLELRALGVQLYIDDFGTGYSSLSNLHRLPINGIKIDKSFIARIGLNGENQEIVKTILMLAKDLNVDVIAEGVETESQRAQISFLEGKYWQGYLYSKPVSSAQAKDLITADIGPVEK
jgi:diguanylate cyclase (GGDEF)-like protein